MIPCTPVTGTRFRAAGRFFVQAAGPSINRKRTLLHAIIPKEIWIDNPRAAWYDDNVSRK